MILGVAEDPKQTEVITAIADNVCSPFEGEETQTCMSMR